MALPFFKWNKWLIDWNFYLLQHKNLRISFVLLNRENKPNRKDVLINSHCRHHREEILESTTGFKGTNHTFEALLLQVLGDEKQHLFHNQSSAWGDSAGVVGKDFSPVVGRESHHHCSAEKLPQPEQRELQDSMKRVNFVSSKMRIQLL